MVGSGGLLSGTVLSQIIRYVVHCPLAVPPSLAAAWCIVRFTVLPVPAAAGAVVTATGLSPPSEPSPSHTGGPLPGTIATGSVVGPATHKSGSATLLHGLATK